MKNKLEKNDIFLQDSNKHNIINFSTYYFNKNNKKKEHPIRFKEKFCFFSKKKIKKKLIWFHGASVGEILSVIPLIEKFEKDKNIHQILITSNTLSSSKIINNLN